MTGGLEGGAGLVVLLASMAGIVVIAFEIGSAFLVMYGVLIFTMTAGLGVRELWFTDGGEANPYPAE